MPTASKYVKGKVLGSGSFGTVYLGTHGASGEQVVIKEVNLRGLNARDVKSSMAEVEVLKKLKHPHVVAYRDSYKESGLLCIVMEYASGGDLGSLIRKKAKEKARLAEPQVLKIIAQLMHALACEHSGLEAWISGSWPGAPKLAPFAAEPLRPAVRVAPEQTATASCTCSTATSSQRTSS